MTTSKDSTGSGALVPVTLAGELVGQRDDLDAKLENYGEEVLAVVEGP